MIDVGDTGVYLVQVAGNAEEVEHDIDRFRFALTVAFALLAIALAIAAAFQVRFGLRPLRMLQSELGEIRRGARERISGRYPIEVAPLVDELNLLIGANRDIVERARTQVGNLAHALKTPLSVIVNEADAAPSPLAEKVSEQATVMRDQITFYLDRARAAARAGAIGSTTQVEPVVAALLRTFAKICAERGVAFSGEAAKELWFLGERQDLEEMVGNLLDNAGKWASGAVSIAVTREAEPSAPGRSPVAVHHRGRRPWTCSATARGGDAARPPPGRNQARLGTWPLDRDRSRRRLWRIAAARRQSQGRAAGATAAAGVLTCAFRSGMTARECDG